MGMLFFHAFLISLGVMFPMINPIGHAPIFYSMTELYTSEERRKTAIKTSWYTFLILFLSLFMGKYVLQFFGLTIDDIRIGGGLLVAAVAWKMLGNVKKITEDEHSAAMEKEDIAFTPMAMPILAGPGAMSLAIGLRSYGDSSLCFAGYVAGFFSIALMTAFFFYFSDYFSKHLKTNTLGALNRLLGFLILGIGVNLITTGIKNILFLHA